MPRNSAARTPEQFLREGRQFLRLGLKEFQEGKRRRLDKRIRQGAEKAWNAAVQGTLALALASGRKLPRSYGAQWKLLAELHRDGDLTQAFLLNAFQNFAKLLHGECFYYGDYSIEEVERTLIEVRRFLDTIERLVRG